MNCRPTPNQLLNITQQDSEPALGSKHDTGDEEYSFVRELEYIDGLDESAEEEADENAEPTTEESGESDDKEDQPSADLDEHDADEEDDEEVRPAKVAKLENMRRHLRQVRMASEVREAGGVDEPSTQIEDEDSTTVAALNIMEGERAASTDVDLSSSTASLPEVNDEATERNPADAAAHEENPSGSSSSGRNERKRSHTHA